MELQSRWTLHKRTGTYADTLAAVGLAQLLDRLTGRVSKVLIQDVGDSFVISTTPIKVEELRIESVRKQPLFQYVKLKDDEIDVPDDAFEYQYHKSLQDAIRERNKTKKSRKLTTEEEAETINPPNPRFSTFQKINLLQGFGARNKLYKQIIAADSDDFRDTILERLRLLQAEGRRPEKKTPFDPDISAVQVFNPIAGKGTNRPKADGASRAPLSGAFVDWFEEWLRYIGSDCVLKGYSFDDDIKMSVPVPKNMTAKSVQRLDVDKGTAAWTSRKSDIFVVLDQVEFLLEEEFKVLEDKSPRDVISSIQTAYFKSLGSGRAVTNISSIGLPGWFPVREEADVGLWSSIVEEHREVLRLIDEEKSEEAELLNLYRDFLSASNWRAFLRFLGAYGCLLMRRREGRGKPARSFTITNLEGLLLKAKSHLPMAEVLSNEGFRNIARAMRRSTVAEQYQKSRGKQTFDIHYGLFQELKRKAKFREQVVERIAEFVNQYNFENARRAERLKEKDGRRRPDVSVTDLEQLFTLFDKHHDHSETIAMMLIAFATAKESTNKDSDGEDE